MNFSQNELLLLYLAVVIVVVASFIFISKKPRDPVKLNLKNTQNKKPAPRRQTAPGVFGKKVPGPETGRTANDSRREKTLNAFFNFDGKSFDAFEVLGLPAGASIKAAQSAFNAQILSAQGTQRALLKAALEAIRRR